MPYQQINHQSCMCYSFNLDLQSNNLNTMCGSLKRRLLMGIGVPFRVFSFFLLFSFIPLDLGHLFLFLVGFCLLLTNAYRCFRF